MQRNSGLELLQVIMGTLFKSTDCILNKNLAKFTNNNKIQNEFKNFILLNIAAVNVKVYINNKEPTLEGSVYQRIDGNLEEIEDEED